MDTGNPYQSPQSPVGVSPDPAQASKQLRIARNIRAICVLYVVFGSTYSLGGFIVLLTAKGQYSSVIAACLILAFGLTVAISAVGVLQKNTLAVPLCQIVSAFFLLAFPVGTFLGGYFLLNVRKVIKKQGRATPCPFCGFVNSADTRICPRCQTRLLTGGGTTTCPDA